MSRVDDLSLSECEGYDPAPHRTGQYQRFKCPRHGGDQQQSLSVGEEGKFRCHNAACSIWGTLLEFQQPGWRSLSSERALQPLQQAEAMTANPAAVDRAVQAWKAFGGSPAEEYARLRGVPDRLARSLRLGYWRGAWQGVDSEWLTFPLRCPVSGRPVGVYGRNVHSDDGPIKGRVLGPKGLFGAFGTEPVPPNVILVEGPFDAIACLSNPHNYPARSLQGATARSEWFDQCSLVLIIFDDDEPGQQATDRLLKDINQRRRRRETAAPTSRNPNPDSPTCGPRVFAMRRDCLKQAFGTKDLGELLAWGYDVRLQFKLPPAAEIALPYRDTPHSATPHREVQVV